MTLLRAEQVRELAQELADSDPTYGAPSVVERGGDIIRVRVEHDESTSVADDGDLYGRLEWDYAQELADDCGMVPSDLSWPLTCIDWEQAARELQQDYTSVSYGGHDYWTLAQ